MDVIAEIRRLHFVENKTVSALALTFKLSRPTIRKHLKTVEEPVYMSRKDQPHPKLGDYLKQLKNGATAFKPSLPIILKFVIAFMAVTLRSTRPQKLFATHQKTTLTRHWLNAVYSSSVDDEIPMAYWLAKNNKLTKEKKLP